ncbi:FG-GAP repeat protein [Candidatus Fermentibacteria bacterium]|nr:FG-GAP repeat protein [Candidatus Fermentibacteria bacterium]
MKISSFYSCLGAATMLVVGGFGLSADPDMTPLYQLSGPGMSQFGRSLAEVGDVDGDGTGDVVVGLRYGSPGVVLYSGASGRALGTFLFPVQPWGFGWTVGRAGDVDGDGVGEVIIGSISEAADSTNTSLSTGRVYLFNPVTREVVLTLVPPDQQQRVRFGWAVSDAGDMNGDGVADVVVSTPYVDLEGVLEVGKAYVMSGADGGMIREFVSPSPEYYGLFGSAVCGGVDLNGDGRGEVVVGAPAEESSMGIKDAGVVHIFDGATGERERVLESPNAEPSGRFGSVVAAVDDVDGDGVCDLVVGAPWEDPGQSPPCAGRAYVFSGASGALIHALWSPNEQENGRFGSSVSRTDDIDGDGIGDVVVGAPWEQGEGEPCEAGRAYVFSGATGALVCALAPPNPTRVGHFGEAVVGLRREGGGTPIVLVGAPGEWPPRVYAFFGAVGAGPSPLGGELAMWVRGNPSKRGRVEVEVFLPERDEVEVRVYNALGRRVGTVWRGFMAEGWHSMVWERGAAGGRQVAGPYVVVARGRRVGRAAALAIVD